MNDEEKSISIDPEVETEEVTAELTKAKGGTAEVAPASLGDEIFSESEGQLTIDVYQTADEIVIESPLAGVEPDNVDISITSESVTIKGKRERSERVKEEDYFYQECYWGKFSRSVILPQEIDSEKSYASIKNGVLTVHLPKLIRTKAKKLKVKID